VAGFQSALFYPPNWLHLLLPPAAAINWNYAAHVFAAGYFTYLWSRRRNTGRFGATVAGVTYMFGAPFFLHVYAGHVIHIQAMTWIPLVFLAIDRLAAGGGMAWTLLGAGAVGLQLLCGSPQYVYYTAICAGVYAILLGVGSRPRVRLALGLCGIYLGGAALAGVQLLPSLDARDELLRSGGLPYKMASSLSFHPHNLVTLVAPYALGTPDGPTATRPQDLPYFGPGYIWELCLYIGISGLVLASLGAVTGPRAGRLSASGTVALAGLLALGAYTPLFDFLYHYLPMYDHFRCTAKFCAVVGLFLSLFAGWGVDALAACAARRPRVVVGFGVGIVAVGVALAAVGEAITTSLAPDGAVWPAFLRSIAATGDLYMEPETKYTNTDFIQTAAKYTSLSFEWAAGTTVAIGLVMVGFRYFPFRGVLVICVVVELFIFAVGAIPTSAARRELPPPWDKALRQIAGYHNRVMFEPSHPANSVMSRGAYAIWAYDPIIVKRYAEFMAFTQGKDPDETTQYLTVIQEWPFTTLYPMLRCRFFFTLSGDTATVWNVHNPMPQALIVYDYMLEPERDHAFRTMKDKSFDPRRRVLLEEEPVPVPSRTGSGGEVRVARQTTDEIELEVDLTKPGILLVTDVYSKGWTARAVIPGPQSEYRILPANYCLRAVPLVAGHHHILMEYRPAAAIAGRWLSGVSLLIFVSVSGWLLRCRRRAQLQTKS
jgi:hypothetical protein